MQPQAIKTRNRSQDEPMAEIESGETYSGIKFKGLNSWVTEVLQSVLNSKQSIAKQKASQQSVQRTAGTGRHFQAVFWL
jgi:hypothetical protein